MQADVFEGDTDEQLIVFDDDRPDDVSDDDDDPGKYGEDAMPDDFFDQFVKHKIPGTRVTNTSANKKSSSSSSVNEGLLLPLRSVTTSEQQPQTMTTTLDREAKQQPENSNRTIEKRRD